MSVKIVPNIVPVDNKLLNYKMLLHNSKYNNFKYNKLCMRQDVEHYISQQQIEFQRAQLCSAMPVRHSHFLRSRHFVEVSCTLCCSVCGHIISLKINVCTTFNKTAAPVCAPHVEPAVLCVYKMLRID